VGRLAALLFFLGPFLLVGLAVSLRTARTVESFESVMDRVRRHEKAARSASQGEGVDLELILAVASAESGGRAEVRSGAGAVGLMQLMPATASEMAEALGEGRPELTDPATSLRLGARYLRRQLDRFSDSPCPTELALAAYNAGPENVQSWRDASGDPDPESVIDWIRFSETRAFVRRVLDYRARYEAESGPSAAR
jgi:soluble lytic murein transglycosylase